MKDAGIVMRKNCLIVFFCIIAGIIFSSCGLEEVLTVEEPALTYNNPRYDSHEWANWYFNFKTSSDSGSNFIGTDVYYKIYNSISTLDSEHSSILSVNTSTNGTAAATRMIETYSYQPLGSSIPTDEAVYFPERGSTVVLRLKSYVYASDASNNDTYFSFHACVGRRDGTEYKYASYIPFRNGNKKSFDFFDEDDDDSSDMRDVLPEYGDSDYKCSDSDKDKSFDEYYVQLFAVGVALNPATVTASYSLVLDLGSVPIRKGE